MASQPAQPDHLSGVRVPQERSPVAGHPRGSDDLAPFVDSAGGGVAAGGRATIRLPATERSPLTLRTRGPQAFLGRPSCGTSDARGSVQGSARRLREAHDLAMGADISSSRLASTQGPDVARTPTDPMVRRIEHFTPPAFVTARLWLPPAETVTPCGAAGADDAGAQPRTRTPTGPRPPRRPPTSRDQASQPPPPRILASR